MIRQMVQQDAGRLDPGQVRKPPPAAAAPAGAAAQGAPAAAAPPAPLAYGPSPEILDPSGFRLGAPGRAPASDPQAVGTNTPSAPQPAATPGGVPADPATPASVTPAPRPVSAADGAAIPSASQAVLSSATNAAGDDALSRRLAQHAQEYPLDLAGHVDYQLLRFVRDEPVPQMEALAGLPQEDRELASIVLDGFSNFRTPLRADNNMLMSDKVRPLLQMADRLRALSELTVPTIVLCSEVRGFGVYEPMGNSFKAGQDNPLIIYCEVENFSSRQNGKQLWETKLNQEVTLYTESGFVAWREKNDIPPDLARNRRHDFYVFKRLTLPRNLSVGRYTLKVAIGDEQAKRIAENSIQINLVAQ